MKTLDITFARYFDFPGLVENISGDLYIADSGNNVIRKVLANTDVIITALSSQVDHLLSGAGGGTPAQVSIAFFNTLAMRIAQSGGAPLDLADLATVQALIGDTAKKVGVTLDPAVSAGAATIAAGVNRYIKDLPVAGSLAYMNQVVKARVVAQNTITPLLAQVGAGPLDINTVVAAATGAALEAQMEDIVVVVESAWS